MNRFAAKLAALRGDKIEWQEGLLRGIIHGPLPNKSNSRRQFVFRGRVKSIKAQDALDWLAAFDVAAHAGQAPAYLSGLSKKEKAKLRYSLTATVYQANLRRDLDIELLCDALQKSGVIHNDRAIWEKHSRREIDRENPRTEFVVRPLTVAEVREAKKAKPGCRHRWVREFEVRVCAICGEERPMEMKP
jgi:Holliday junction resolvase RusA-like endonuclease